MKRYIKVNDNWIDTKVERESWGRYYYLKVEENDNNIVYYYSDEYGVDYQIGVLEKQTDNINVLKKEYNKWYYRAQKLQGGCYAWKHALKKCEEIKAVLSDGKN